MKWRKDVLIAQFAPLRFNASSNEYLEVHYAQETLMFTPDFTDNEYDSDIEVQVFGGTELPWGRGADGFFACASSVYDRRDYAVRAYFE